MEPQIIIVFLVETAISVKPFHGSRSTMEPIRFNSLSILHQYKERCRNIDLIDIVNLFVCNDNRFSHFVVFTKEDL